MRIINKKYLVIILLVGVILTGVILAKTNKEEKLDDVILKQEVNNNAFAMYTEIENGYQKYEGYSFPKGYVLNLNKSKCMDNKGNEIENALYTKNDQVGVKSNKSFYCYLYFDLLEEKEFDYTGSYQVFIAPKTGNYQIELWGASGGSTETGAEGGKGAYTKGTITLNKQDKLYIFVGEEGHHYTPQVDYVVSETFNGGGNGKQHPWTAAASGGGATDVRLEISDTGNWNDFNSLKSRIMVAAGGGGAFWWNNSGNINGGFGGALNGGNGEIKYDPIEESDNRVLANPIGGTQTSGGIPNDNKTEESFGKFGIGGNYIMNDTRTRAGGGSGYYGGGGGVDEGMTGVSGAGGSSFISGYKGCIAIKKESAADNIITNDGCTEESPNITCSYHYSGKVFIDMEMIAGNTEMPTHDGKDKMVGNNGNGYARIKLINVVS